MKKILFIILLLFGIINVVQAANPVAIPFKYYVVKNTGRHIMLAATSDDIDFIHLSGPTPNWGTRYNSNRWGSSSAITNWVLTTLPSHGVLYDNGNIVTGVTNISGPDNLYYKPNAEYVGDDNFTYHVVDSHGTSADVTVSLVVASPDNYPMPYGISNPNFGINEIPPSDPSAWPHVEVVGFYYFDNNDPNCSDANTYGYPDVPRCTLPGSLMLGNDQKAVFAPGSNITTTRSFVNINFNGSPGHEAWLVGVENTPTPPRITFTDNTHEGKNLRLIGANYRITGLEFVDVMLRQYNSNGDNAVVRHSVIHDYYAHAGNVFEAGNGGHNILSFQLYLYNIGTIESDLSAERDVHAFDGINQHNWWILDCLVAGTAGDSLQVTNNNTTSDIWVGRLTAHTAMENCVDVKDFNNMVVSESDCWDIRTVTYGNSGGNAQNFYVNDEGSQQGYFYFLNNRSWDTMGDTFATANVGGKVYFIGNRGFFSPQATGLGGYSGGGNREYYLNSIHNVGTGMYFYNSGSALNRYAVGNFIGMVNNYGGFITNPNAFDQLDYNMYSNNSTFAWGSTSSPNTGIFAQWKSANSIEAHSVENVNENIPNINSYDFSIQTPSDLVDVIPSASLTTLMPGLTDLQNDLGVQVKDYLGTIRSINDMDIGAYEYTPSTNLRADVDNNSQINTTDSMLTLRNSLGLDMSGTNWQTSTITGDADCDGDTDSTDAMLILRYSLGLDMSGTGWCGN